MKSTAGPISNRAQLQNEHLATHKPIAITLTSTSQRTCAAAHRSNRRNFAESHYQQAIPTLSMTDDKRLLLRRSAILRNILLGEVFNALANTTHRGYAVKRLSRYVAPLVFVFALSSVAFGQPGQAGRNGSGRTSSGRNSSRLPGVGTQIPELTVYDQAGNEFSTKVLREHYSVLVFGCLT